MTRRNLAQRLEKKLRAQIEQLEMANNVEGLARLVGRDPLDDWRDAALCAQMGDPDWWFPDHMGSAIAAEAAAICGMCEVKIQCAQHAKDHDERDGIWGGINKRQKNHTPRSVCPHGGESISKCLECHRDRTRSYQERKRTRQLLSVSAPTRPTRKA